MTKQIVLASAVALVAGIASSAQAGFIASTNVGTYSYTGTGSITSPAVGGTINVANLALASYTPDTAADPQITTDLNRFLLTLNLAVAPTPIPSGTSFRTNGLYNLSYDLNGNGAIDIGEPRVSAGIAALDFTQAFSGFDVVAGSLAQTAGPSSSAFADLAYGNNANIVLQGGYLDTLGGNIALNLTQRAVVPEPATLAGLTSVAAMALIRRRRGA